jgi:hypothetical protein
MELKFYQCCGKPTSYAKELPGIKYKYKIREIRIPQTITQITGK